MSIFTTVILIIYTFVMVFRFMVNLETNHYADAILNMAEIFMFIHIINNV